MPKPNPEAEFALHKLGERLRAGFAKQHPVQEKTLETVKDTVRGQYEQEQEAGRAKKPVPNAAKDQKRQPPEPER